MVEGGVWCEGPEEERASSSSSSRGRSTKASISLEGYSLARMDLYCSMLVDSLSTSLAPFFSARCFHQVASGLTSCWARPSGRALSSRRPRGAGTTGTDHTVGCRRSGSCGGGTLRRHCWWRCGASRRHAQACLGPRLLNSATAGRPTTGRCGTWRLMCAALEGAESEKKTQADRQTDGVVSGQARMASGGGVGKRVQSAERGQKVQVRAQGDMYYVWRPWQQ